MTMLTVEKVGQIFAETGDLDPNQVDETTKLRAFDWLDSLDLAEFFMRVEEEYGVELPDHRCIGFQTVGDVAEHVDRALKAQNR